MRINTELTDAIHIQALDERRFAALVGASRHPAAQAISHEVAWFANEAETLLGVVVFDLEDQDFASILLARDLSLRFRAFEQEVGFETIEAAEYWLRAALRWHTGQGLAMVPQGDERSPKDPFQPTAAEADLHPYFVRLAREAGYSPAKRMVSELFHHFHDVDGNFVQQFQTGGFDARLWELYVFAYLVEAALVIERHAAGLDFFVSRGNQNAAVEAVVVGRETGNPPRYFYRERESLDPGDVAVLNSGAMPIRFGSPLYRKLNERYWERPRVAGRPLVFAIADFHDDHSMLWSSTALVQYLYGIRHEFEYDAVGKLVIKSKRIETHRRGSKKIPSGFFFLPEAEHVSAVLFSNSGTVSKLNRMGLEAGFGAKGIAMLRAGTCHDHDPNAAVPNRFEYWVREGGEETWAEGLSMFHNPNSLHPADQKMFPTVAHHHFHDGEIVSWLPKFHPYASVTYVFRPAS